MTRKPTCALSVAVAATAPLFMFAGSAAAQFTFDRVALTGTPAPDAPAGTNYSSTRSASIDNGYISFAGSLSGPGAASVVYAGQAGSLKAVLSSTSPMPGFPNERYNGFNTDKLPVINGTGLASVYALSRDFTTNVGHEGYYAGAIDAIQPAVIRGSQAAGLGPGITYLAADNLVLNDTGEMGFAATLNGPGITNGNRDILYAGSLAAPQIVAREGSQAPDLPSGLAYGGFGPLMLADAGRVGFQATLQGSGLTSLNDTAIYTGTIAAPRLIARAGNTAPGTPSGVMYASVTFPTINSAGDVGYVARLTGPGVNSATNGTALYAGRADAPQLYFRQGDAVPGTASIFGSGFQQPHLNDAGGIAFEATVLSGSPLSATEAIFAGSLSALPRIIARRGDQAPQLPAGVILGDMFIGAFNDLGQVVIVANLAGANVSSDNDQALFAYDSQLGLRLVARTGDLFDVGGGVMRVIRSRSADGIAFATGRGDDARVGLDDRGTLVLGLNFTDFSNGVFTTAVPEPHVVIGVAGACGVLGLERSSRRRPRVR